MFESFILYSFHNDLTKIVQSSNKRTKYYDFIFEQLLQKSKIEHKTALEAAIAWLIGQRVIRDRQDVMSALNMKSKGTFSDYFTGRKSPSKAFVLGFEKQYGVVLSDFENGNWPTADPLDLNSDVLEQILEAIESRHRVLLAIIYPHLKGGHGYKSVEHLLDTYDNRVVSEGSKL